MARYVDDILIMAANNETLVNTKKILNARFKMTDMVTVRWFLGMNIMHKKEGIYITQTSYINKILERFNLRDAKIKAVPLSKDVNFRQLIFPEGNDPRGDCPYRELVGCLLYLSVCTRPDISLAVSELSRFVSDPHDSHWNLLKGVVWYLKGTKELGLFYANDDRNSKFHVYVDASWADDIETRRSTTGILAYVGKHLVDWTSKRQSIIAHSTAEAEYIAADSATRMIVWFRTLLMELGDEQREATVVHEDNRACIILSRGEGKFLTSKHISLRYHYLNEKVLSKEIALEYIPTEEQLADLLTKPLATVRFKELLANIGLTSKLE